jgi:hypothetical protein
VSELDLARLADKFPEDCIEWRIGSQALYNGKPWATCLAYLTNRAIMDRLDEICGSANWRNEFRQWHGESQLCGISIRIDGEWITKWDGAPNTGIEPIKGGLSDSMKRAAVLWGIARYLYDLPDSKATFLDQREPGAKRTKIENTTYWWRPPPMPASFLPAPEGMTTADKLPPKSPQPEGVLAGLQSTLALVQADQLPKWAKSWDEVSAGVGKKSQEWPGKVSNAEELDKCHAIARQITVACDELTRRTGPPP